MAYCGVHFRKLKTAAHIKKACSHDRRSHRPKNVNPDRVSQNITLLDHGRDRWEIINEQISKRVKRKVRDNAVRMIEAFVYASPEYFRPNTPDTVGTWEDKRLKPWTESVYKWLLAEYGQDNVLEAHLHLDEATPHIHAVILPITADGRLTAKDYLMNRVGLRNAQSSLAKALAPLGLTRGLKGSGAKHISADTWSSEIQKCLTTFSKPPKPEPAGKLPAVSSKKYNKLKKNYTHAVSVLRKAEKKVAHTQTVQAENQQLKKVNSAYARELEQLRPLAKKVRGIEIRQILKDHKQGSEIYLDKKGRANSRLKPSWIGRNAIDVVMHLNDCDYKNAILWLYNKYDIERTTSCVQNVQRPELAQEILQLVHDAQQLIEEQLAERDEIIRILDEQADEFDPNWRDRTSSQRQYFILYRKNIEPEFIEDFRVWENKNGKFLKHCDGYHIWDKGDRLILKNVDGKDLKKAVSLMLEMAIDKNWELSTLKATGLQDFLKEIEQQVKKRLNQQAIQPSPCPPGMGGHG